MAVLDFLLSGSQRFAIIAALLSPLLMKQFIKKTIIAGVLLGIGIARGSVGGYGWKVALSVRRRSIPHSVG